MGLPCCVRHAARRQNLVVCRRDARHLPLPRPVHPRQVRHEVVHRRALGEDVPGEGVGGPDVPRVFRVEEQFGVFRLREGEAEVVIERSFLGLKSTHSMFVQVLVEADAARSSKQVVLHGGPIAETFPALKRGGRFGRLTVPQGYLYLVRPTFFQLGEVYGKELEMAFRKMHDIRLEDGQLVLVPRQAMMAPDSR